MKFEVGDKVKIVDTYGLAPGSGLMLGDIHIVEYVEPDGDDTFVHLVNFHGGWCEYRFALCLEQMEEPEFSLEEIDLGRQICTRKR